ncbi:hypothetical protein IAT40_007984 [Kwoniella sp. CBS 6097]
MRSPSPTLSDSELLDSLDEAGFDLASDRERRIEALQREIRQVKDLRDSEYGKVITFIDEKKLIERMSNEKYCLIHFVHPDFARCAIMDQRLAEIAPAHPHTLFLRANVSDVPFLVAKMAVQVLPCVLAFVNGKAVDRLIGFEELGDTDKFSAKMLEFRLNQSGVFPSDLSLASNISSSLLAGTKSRGAGSGSDDSGDEDDKSRRATSGGGAGGSSRRGKVGIRNGFAGNGSDDDY